MTYQETLEFLYQQLPMYQRLGKSAYKKDLNNTFALSRFLGKPEFKFKSIHIAGTNGKGSTSHILSAIYQNNGYKVGLYTSPHLVDFRERIKINGEMLPQSFVIDFVKRIKNVLLEIKPSFFEMTVAMAFDYFAQQEVDIAVIETGLGGRLDSTNIIIPELSVITSISKDHTDMLGDSIEKIAFEKAGIIKYGKPIVVSLVPEEAEKVIREIAEERQALYFDALRSPHRFTANDLVETDLKGNYQQLNIKAALIAVDALNEIWPVQDNLILDAIKNVCFISKFQGRWQMLSEQPPILCDVAHNEEGIQAVLSQLKDMGQQVHFILGFVNDKDIRRICALFPKDMTYSFVKPSVIRGLEADLLQKSFAKAGLAGDAFPSLKDAIEDAKKRFMDKKCELIYIGGSNFLVADALALQQ